MSLIIGDNFSYQAQDPLDARLVTQSLTTLLAVPDYTIYDGIQVYVLSEKKFYVYDSKNDNDQVLGRWKEFTVDGSTTISEILKYSKAFTKDVNEDEVIKYSDISGANAITEIKSNQLMNDVSGIIAKVISTDEANSEVQIRILSKDTIVKNDVIQYNGELDAEIDKVQNIDFTKVNTTEAIADFSSNNLIYDQNGILAKVLNKDVDNNELIVIPITLSIAIQSHEVYLTNTTINPKISSQSLINFVDLVNVNSNLTNIEPTQLVYDMEGTLAKIDLVDVNNNTITVTTINTSSDKSVKTYKYLGTGLSKTPDFKSSINYSDIDTTQLLNTIKVDELVYDEEGTLAKIIMVDVQNAQLLVQTLTVSGMPYAPVLKELVVKEGGANYVVGDIFESSNTPGIFGEVTAVDSNGSILSVSSTTNTIVKVSGHDATIDYETVIYGAFGRNWAALSNTSSSVAQIVEESFIYETGFNYEITNGGSNYKVGDVANVVGNMVEITKVNAGVVEEVRWSREVSTSTLGTGLVVNITSSDDSFIIPTNIWNNSNRNSFDLTNNDGANVEFNRLDGVDQKCAAGDGSIYKFTFDSKNGVIYQEKTEVDGGNGIGPFIPHKNYKKDSVIINDNIIYICKDEHISDATLGDDILHWTEMRKQMTSGLRHVRFQVPKQTKPISTWNKVDNITFVEGDQSMLSSDKLKAPVDGLYYTTTSIATSLNGTGSSSKCLILRVSNQDGEVKGMAESQGQWESQVSLSFVTHLKAGEELSINYYYTALPRDGGFVSEFGLISDDRNDNLVAEADLVMPASISARTYTTLTYENTSNLGIISTNGVITLPEDGSYMLSIDNLISSTGGTSGSLETILTIKDGTAVDALTTITHVSCTKLQSAGFTHIITGSKGDTFTIKTYRSETQSNLTKSYVQKIRLFKIKSVDYHIDSHDLHKDSGSIQTYEDWVKSQMKENQLSVTAQVVVGQTLVSGKNNLIKYSYVSGENEMLQEESKFVAPVPGLYTLNFNPISLTSSLSISLAAVKNDSTSTDWFNVIYYANVTSNWTSSGNIIVWLNKGEYLCMKARPANNVSIKSETGSQLLGGITFTLLNSGLAQVQPYTADKPHLWPDNQEVDLGDGLYGYKAVGTITVRAGLEIDVAIPITEDITLVNWNAWFKHNPNTDSWLSGSAGNYISFLFKTDKLYYRTKTTVARTNYPYSVWLTYTKGGNI